MSKAALKIGLDVGNQNTKVCFSGSKKDGTPLKGKAISRSFVRSMEADDQNPKCLVLRTLEDSRGIPKASGWGFGGDTGVLDKRDGKAQFSLPLFVETLWSELPDDVHVVDAEILVSAQNVPYYSESIPAALNGTHTAKFKGIKREFNLSVRKVIQEGAGVLKVADDVELEDNALLDLGGGTVIATPFQGLKILSGCKPYVQDAQGVSQVISEFAKNDSYQRETGFSTMSFAEARKVFESPKAQYSSKAFPGLLIDMKEERDAQLEKWLTARVEKALHDLRAHLSPDTGRVATGGGCSLPGAAKLLQKYGFKTVSDPLFANAKGLLVLLGGAL